MSTLTQVGNTSIEGNATTLADGDLDPTNDKVIVLDTSTTSLKEYLLVHLVVVLIKVILVVD